MNQEVMHRQGRTRRELVLAAGALGFVSLAGCPSAPKPPKPVVAKLTLEASKDLNPDQRGRPSPATVKLFDLKSSASFEKADFFSLFDRERETLGPELVGRDELVLRPSDRVVREDELAPEVQFIGVLVGYRDLERSQWRLVIPVATVRSKPAIIEVGALRVSLK